MIPSRRLYLSGVPVDNLTLDELVIELVDLATGSDPVYVCYVNAHVHNLARRDRQLREVLNRSRICYADGVGIVWACRRLGKPLRSRMTAADFMPRVIAQMHRAGRRVFLLGGQPGVAHACSRRMAEIVPGFAPAGCRHGHFSDGEAALVADEIRAARPDLLIVGMGTPRQELWIARYGSELQVPLTWAAGAVFDYAAGRQRRCPAWMGRYGLEWLYRLWRQPRRMARRYLLGNPAFVWNVLREARK